MRAVAITKHGDIDALDIVDYPEQELRYGLVRIWVEAVAINHLDIWVRRGWPGLEVEMPHVLGSDIVGVVVDVGPGVTRWKAGDRVVVAPGFGCGTCKYCLGGDESCCDDYHIYGEDVPGGLRERFVVAEANLLPMPKNLTFVQAAAVPLTFMTAWRMLMRRAQVGAGEVVLVQAGASGVGTAAIQIAALAGAKVIATGSTEAKCEHARRMGADVAVDSSLLGWRKEVKRLTSGRGVDLVIEHVGGTAFEESLATLRPGGRLVTCGATIGADVQLDLRHIFSKQLSVIGSTMGSRADLAHVLDCVERGLLRPVVDSVLPLNRISSCHELLEDRSVVGKVVIEMSSTAGSVSPPVLQDPVV